VRQWLARQMPQPLVAVAICALAALSLGVSYWPYLQRPGGAATLESAPLLLCAMALLVCVVLAYKFPIHLRFQLKIYMSSVPLYLMAVLLPPPLAATLAGAGMLTGELMVQAERKNYPSDIATNVARWIPVALLSSLVAHGPLNLGPAGVLALVAAAVVMQLGDMLTLPLLLGPMSGEERPLRLMGPLLRDGGLAEGAQYLLGLLGALAAERTLWALGLLVLPTGLVWYAFKLAREMHDSTRRMLEQMADTVDLRDPYTGGHSRRVTAYAQGILRELDLHGMEVDLIVAAARVHDIGKIGIPDVVLNKPGKLDPQERAIMETHAERGAELLGRHSGFARGVEIVRHHHESWDGTGYPHRLAGTAIPFGARVLAVADSYDAMTSDRPYRTGMAPQKAAAILREGRGRQWDAPLVDAFLRSVADSLAESDPPHLRLVPPQTHTATA